jgi:hypothetical protein
MNPAVDFISPPGAPAAPCLLHPVLPCRLVTHRAAALHPLQADTTTSIQDSINARKKLTLALILPAVLVPCTLMILLVFVIAFGMVYFRSETERLGRAFAPGVGKETTLLVTDIQVTLQPTACPDRAAAVAAAVGSWYWLHTTNGTIPRCMAGCCGMHVL